jgi:hypothetical protein
MPPKTIREALAYRPTPEYQQNTWDVFNKGVQYVSPYDRDVPGEDPRYTWAKEIGAEWVGNPKPFRNTDQLIWVWHPQTHNIVVGWRKQNLGGHGFMMRRRDNVSPEEAWELGSDNVFNDWEREGINAPRGAIIYWPDVKGIQIGYYDLGAYNTFESEQIIEYALRQFERRTNKSSFQFVGSKPIAPDEINIMPGYPPGMNPHIKGDAVDPQWEDKAYWREMRGKLNWRTSTMTRTKYLELAQTLPPDTSTIVHKFPNGWTIRKLNTWNDAHREGILMNNCITPYFDYQNEELRPLDAEGFKAYDECWENSFEEWMSIFGRKTIGESPFSLRDTDNLPRVTFYYGSYGPTAIYGRHNGAVKPEYEAMLREWSGQDDISTGMYSDDIESFDDNEPAYDPTMKWSMTEPSKPDWRTSSPLVNWDNISDQWWNDLEIEIGKEPERLYHVAPSSARDQITLHGLLPTHPTTSPWKGVYDDPRSGVFAWISPQEAEDYVVGVPGEGDFDVWEVNHANNYFVQDEEDDFRSWYSTSPVPPQNVNLFDVVNKEEVTEAWHNKYGMAERTGEPEIDALIESFIEKNPEVAHCILDIPLDPPTVPLKELRHPGWASNKCGEVSALFADWCEENGYPAHSYQTAGIERDHPLFDTNAIAFGEQQPVYHPDFWGYQDRMYQGVPGHDVTLIQGQSGIWYMVDWSAAQYGYKEFPMVQRIDDVEGLAPEDRPQWERKWSAITSQAYEAAKAKFYEVAQQFDFPMWNQEAQTWKKTAYYINGFNAIIYHPQTNSLEIADETFGEGHEDLAWKVAEQHDEHWGRVYRQSYRGLYNKKTKQLAMMSEPDGDRYMGRPTDEQDEDALEVWKRIVRRAHLPVKEFGFFGGINSFISLKGESTYDPVTFNPRVPDYSELAPGAKPWKNTPEFDPKGYERLKRQLTGF